MLVSANAACFLHLLLDVFNLLILVLDLLVDVADLAQQACDCAALVINVPGSLDSITGVLCPVLLAVLLVGQVSCFLFVQSLNHFVNGFNHRIKVALIGHRDPACQCHETLVTTLARDILHHTCSVDNLLGCGLGPLSQTTDLEQGKSLRSKGALEVVAGIITVKDGNRLAHRFNLLHAEVLAVLPFGLLCVHGSTYLRDVSLVIIDLCCQGVDLSLGLGFSKTTRTVLFVQPRQGCSCCISLGRLGR
mmetsp:Transcript_55321/g.132002  ORF Transcript_55321/g.132002 Transcript_55321/m.132002 type:complete len:248 (+) Transcript_55321:673-1416(+)